MSDESVPRIDLGGFVGVDGSRDPEQFVEWMDHQRTRVNDRLFGLLDIQPEEAVLDIGCGTGVDVAAISQLTDRTIGIDLSETMAHAAARRCQAGRCAIAIADAQQLPFPASSFDAVCVRAVLVHTPHPQVAMTEVHRVLKPGGRAVFAEPDQGSHIVASSEPDVFDRILRHRRSRFLQPLIGRSLAELASSTGLEVTACWALPIMRRSLASALASGGPFGVAVDTAVEDGAISAAEAARYNESLTVLDEQGAFFFAALSVVVTATRPDCP